jgi:iron complex outermembrane receptor protein
LLVIQLSRGASASGFVCSPQNGTESFVDLNSIPLAAVDRIEILKDGASATYGSDAIAGVVNVILKDEYDGADIRSNDTVDT